MSPGAYVNEILGDARDAQVFQYLLEQLNQLLVAYVHTGNFNDKVTFKELHQKTMTEFMRTYFKGILIATGSYDFQEGQEKIKNEQFDLLGIGRPFIANPNLIQKLHNNETISPYDASMLTTLF